MGNHNSKIAGIWEWRHARLRGALTRFGVDEGAAYTGWLARSVHSRMSSSALRGPREPRLVRVPHIRV
jgi:hypothetical protein